MKDIMQKQKEQQMKVRAAICDPCLRSSLDNTASKVAPDKEGQLTYDFVFFVCFRLCRSSSSNKRFRSRVFLSKLSPFL
jgi:hypothetical protein